MYPEKPMCHKINSVFTIADHIEWLGRDGFRHCSYCGSLHPEDLLKRFAEGARLVGADWKYGWPHKFYVEGAGPSQKFYNEHLKDLIGEPEFAEVAEAIYEHQDGKYYPLVAFTSNGPGHMGYAVRAGNIETWPKWSYADLVAWAKEQGKEKGE